ncbi:MAG: class I SAM-dependent RNA methyltransferase [Clostridia bacterium]|nr:class I SAM-dependent RNA methyltransferase [Clostridia bacterium]
MKFCAPCLFGTEGLLAEELRDMDCCNVLAENGRVLFEGDTAVIARANICSRIAERIMIVAGTFRAVSFDDLFEGVKAIHWSEYLPKNACFPVKGWSLNSALHSIPDCQKIIKKAVVDSMSRDYGIRWFSEDGPIFQIRFSILKDEVTLMIDTSGDGLHKRGYRAHSNEAPIKETLAAALCKIARVREYHTLYDPFCGSGTILIEGAMIANNIMPGYRRGFVSEQWDFIKKEDWQMERTRALDGIKHGTDFHAYGSDINPAAVELSHSNATHFGVRKFITLSQKDIKDFTAESEKGTLITNPPYGERMMDMKAARELYRTMGTLFEPKRGWSYNIISPDEEFEKIYGSKARKRRKLYNGMIKCTYYSYF